MVLECDFPRAFHLLGLHLVFQTLILLPQGVNLGLQTLDFRLLTLLERAYLRLLPSQIVLCCLKRQVGRDQGLLFAGQLSGLSVDFALQGRQLLSVLANLSLQAACTAFLQSLELLELLSVNRHQVVVVVAQEQELTLRLVQLSLRFKLKLRELRLQELPFLVKL